MNYCKKLFQGLLAFSVLIFWAPSALHAESQSPHGDPGLFLGEYYDPTARGHKLSGTLAIVYDKTAVPETECGTFSRINKIYVSITMGQNQTYAPFTTAQNAGFCMADNDRVQVELIVGLIRDKVIPFYFGCTTACPGFKVKSVTDYQYTTGTVGDHPLPVDLTSGGVSATFTIAVN